MDLSKIPVGEKPPHDVNVVIENPLGGDPVKYELDKASAATFVDRFLHTAMYYPGNYRFVPHLVGRRRPGRRAGGRAGAGEARGGFEVSDVDRQPMAAILEIVVGDITRLAVDAIANAANSALAGGGGVDGAIHRAAGPELMEECRRIGHCPPGEARITAGYRLPARHVIHCVGPVWHGGDLDEDRVLASCYGSALLLAQQHGCASIAFPAISTGVYGFPPERAAPIAVAAVREALVQAPAVQRVIFCCFNDAMAEHYRRALGAEAGPS